MASLRKIYEAKINELTGPDSIRILNAMEGHFGDDGSRWGKGAYGFMQPQKCLVGCLLYMRAKKVAHVDMAHNLIMKAIRERYPSSWFLEQFNDAPLVTYADILSVIRRAKQLAMPVTITPTAKPPLRLAAPTVTYFPPTIQPGNTPAISYEHEKVFAPRFEPEVEKVLCG